MTTGKENLYHKLNGLDANIFYRKQVPKGFEKCIAFVGGFVDSCFFCKHEIESLNENEQQLFLKILKTPKNLKECEIVKIKEDKRTIIEKSNWFLGNETI